MNSASILGLPNLVAAGDDKGELYGAVLRQVNGMSDAEVFASLVRTGIYTPSGELTKEYGGASKRKSKRS